MQAELTEDVRYTEAVHALHERCAVYTTPAVVRAILDRIGWEATADLSRVSLLEPAAGEGEFVVQAAVRLVEWWRRKGVEPTARHLRTRILAFEFHAEAALTARRRIVAELLSIDVHPRTASACARAWIRVEDFLLSGRPAKTYTHVVGNPPYMRWNKVPPLLRVAYEEVRSSDGMRGDLYLPFLDEALQRLMPGGKCAFVCSDRWQYAAYGARFRRKWLPRLAVLSNDPVDAGKAFTRTVSAYARVFIAVKKPRAEPLQRAARPRGPGRTLLERGCRIRVGPALGVTSAFVVDAGTADVEEELLLPWVESKDIYQQEVPLGWTLRDLSI